jgi:hypothetical protein
LVWRWQVAATSDGNVQLQLLALPYSRSFIKGNPAFFNDTTAAVLLQKFDLECLMFDGLLGAGPVPCFFSAKPEESLAR